MKTQKMIVLLVLFFKCTFLFQAQTCKEIIGYYPNWQWYDRSKLVNPSTINYSKYSIINYCFFKPESTGLISSTDAWADENLLKGQINWSTTPTSYYPNTSIIDKAHNAGTKVMVSIGGWTLSDHFPSIAANPSKRAIFASECNRLLREYKFDGIDIDWEYPGFVEHSGTTADKQNFTIFIQQIKDSITAQGQRLNKNYKLSACFGASAAHASNIEWNLIASKLDMINLMTYDFFGAWDCKANHNSPLYAPASGDASFNLDAAFKLLTQTYNVPASKINLGIGFYGRSQLGASSLYGNTNCTANTALFSEDEGTPLYYNIQKNMNLFNEYWDASAQVPYLLGKSGTQAAGTFVSFDNKKSVGKKAEYIVNNNARGAIIWEITGDYIETSVGSGVIAATPLVDTLNTVFCSLINTQNPTITNTVSASRCGNGTVVLSATANLGTISWYTSPNGGVSVGTGTTFITPVLSSTTTYYVETNNNGVISTPRQAVIATINQIPSIPTVSANGPLTFCQGNNVILTSSSATGNVWSNGAVTQSITVSASGNYYVTVGNSGCTSTSLIKVITVNPLPSIPTISANGALSFCQGDNVILTSSSATGNVWSNGAVTQNITVSSSGNYTVTVTELGCSSSSISSNVTVNPYPNVSFNLSQDTICLDASPLQLSGGQPSGGVYSGIGVNNNQFHPQIAGTGDFLIEYTVVSNGCSASSSVGIEVEECDLGLEQIDLSSIVQIYPNPFSSMVNIVNVKKYELEICVKDINGKKIIDKILIDEFDTIDFEKFDSGVYFLDIKMNSNVMTTKLVKL